MQTSSFTIASTPYANLLLASKFVNYRKILQVKFEGLEGYY